MFDLPDAKRVRRSDLYTRSQSSSPAPSTPDPEVSAQLHDRLTSLYGSSLSLNPDFGSDNAVRRKGDADGDAAQGDEEGEQEFEFRLFSLGTTKAGGEGGEAGDITAQRILLSDGEENVGEGGFIKARDPRVWTFGEDRERRSRFESVAFRGEDVLCGSKRRAWGLEVPWRVKVLKAVGTRKIKGSTDNDEENCVESAVITTLDEEGTMKKKTPGKKRRIALREKKRSSNDAAEGRRIEREAKEEAEREKKTRRNREKKVKRKLKEKAKKSKTGDGGGKEDTSMGGDGNTSQ